MIPVFRPRNPRAFGSGCLEGCIGQHGIRPLVMMLVDCRCRAPLKLTFDIVLCICLRRLIVMHHFHDLQQVIFPEFLQVFCELLHINLHRKMLIHTWKQEECSEVRSDHTPLSGLVFFFLADSSPRFDFTPFSSAKVGPVSLRAVKRPGLGFLKVYQEWH